MLIKPDFKITTSKRDITEALTDRVGSVEVISHAGQLSDQLIITLDDHRDNRMQLPPLGEKIRIAIGYKESDKLVDHGEYEVAEYAISGNRDSLTIYANKLLFNGALTAPTQKSWPSSVDEPLTIGQLIDDIAAKQGLQSRVNPDLGPIKLPAISQSESDLHLIARIASCYDATARIVENYLIFMPRCSGLSQSGSELPRIPLDRQQLIRWEVLTSHSPGYTGCKAFYHDFIAAERKLVEVGSSDRSFTINETFADETTAQHAATARFNDFKRTEKTLSIQSVGEANLKAGLIVELAQVHGSVDGPWCLTKVHHKIDSKGFSSSIEGELLQT